MFEMKDGYIQKENRKGTRYIENGQGELIAKQCCKCANMKDLDMFKVNKGGFGGRRSNCKVCAMEHQNKYRKEHPEIQRAVSKKYYEKNRRNRLEYTKQWKKENPEKVGLQNQRRRSLKSSLPVTLSKKQSMILLENKNCVLSCTSENLHLEHFIPLSWGAGGTTFENCYYMEGTLNNSKRNKNPFEWIKTQPEEYQHNFHTKLVPMLAERNGMSVEAFTEYVYQCESNKKELV